MNDKLIKMFIARFDALEAENKQIIKKINAKTKAETVSKSAPVSKKGNMNTEYESQWVITEVGSKGGYSVLHRFKSVYGNTETDATKMFNKYKNIKSDNQMVLTYASYQGNYPKPSDYIELDRF